jgi:hypothetical protein
MSIWAATTGITGTPWEQLNKEEYTIFRKVSGLNWKAFQDDADVEPVLLHRPSGDALYLRHH